MPADWPGIPPLVDIAPSLAPESPGKELLREPSAEAWPWLEELELLDELEELGVLEGKPGRLGELEDDALGILGVLLELDDVDALGMLGMLLELEELDALGMLGILELDELWLDDSHAASTPAIPTRASVLPSLAQWAVLPLLPAAMALLNCLFLAVFMVSL